MKKLAGIVLVLCLAFVGCSDDSTPPADGGTDAVAEASVEASVADGNVETSPKEASVPDAGTETGPSEAGTADGAATDQGGD